MKRAYKTRAVDRVFHKNTDKLRDNVGKLIRTTGYFTSDKEEMFQEMCILFYKNFDEFYENDRQYLSFLFICMKNKIRNHQRKEYTNANRFTTDLSSVSCAIHVSQERVPEKASYQYVWRQVKDPHCDWTESQIKELVEKAKSKLDNRQLEVFCSVVEDGECYKEIVEINKLRNAPRLSLTQKTRLTVLEKKPGLCGMNLSMTVDFIQESIKPTLFSFAVQEGLC